MTMIQRLHQYGLLIRWNKPVGTLLMLWPVLTALLIATEGHPSAKLIFIFVFGTFVMRAAGCIINDIADRKFDKYVARTATRPLTAGAITLLPASVLLAILLLIALLLVLALNLYCLLIAVIGVILSGIYPLMKRCFQLPQGILGIVFNLGILMAFAASQNAIPFNAWFLFMIAVLWTIAYDTLYAMGDKTEDIALGLNSSAIFFGHYDYLITAILQFIVIILLFILGILLQATTWFYLGVVLTLGSFVFQQWLIRDRQSANCLAAFTNNQWSWFFIFFGMLLSYSK